MCTVIEFPKGRKLPKDIEYRLSCIANDFVGAMFEGAYRMYGDDMTDSEIDEFGELLMEYYEKGIKEAIKALCEED